MLIGPLVWLGLVGQMDNPVHAHTWWGQYCRQMQLCNIFFWARRCGNRCYQNDGIIFIGII